MKRDFEAKLWRSTGSAIDLPIFFSIFTEFYRFRCSFLLCFDCWRPLAWFALGWLGGGRRGVFWGGASSHCGWRPVAGRDYVSLGGL